MNDTNKEHLLKIVVWAFLPRSLGMLLGASSLALAPRCAMPPNSCSRVPTGLVGGSFNFDVKSSIGLRRLVMLVAMINHLMG